MGDYNKDLLGPKNGNTLLDGDRLGGPGLGDSELVES